MQFNPLKRRELITLLGGAVATWPLTVRAQQNGSMRRVAVLMNLAAENSDGQARFAALSRALKGLGWIEGQEPRRIYGLGASLTSPRDASNYVALLNEALIRPTKTMPAATSMRRTDE